MRSSPCSGKTAQPRSSGGPIAIRRVAGSGTQRSTTSLFLQGFLMQYESSQALAQGQGQRSSEFDMGAAFKVFQRKSANFKVCWAKYVEIYGDGTRDPSKQPRDFLDGFVDWVCEQGMAAMGSGDSTDSISGPPAKRQRANDWSGGAWSGGDWSGGADGGWGGMASMLPMMAAMVPLFAAKAAKGGCWAKGAAGAFGTPAAGSVASGKGAAGWPRPDQAKQALVDRIKAFQRSDPSLKEAWWAYCDEMLGGVRDPARHSADDLLAFVDANGVP
mmetsp:Transcript_14072/g.40548  ORF Transcript_14072/g.40548 Transcript_14072/m.40548 type:complete len:273 (-) Transcript_14072:107-925(-)